MLSTGQSVADCNRCLPAFLLRAVFHYVSPAAEDTDFCSVGAGLHRLSALHQEDVDGEVRPQSTRPLSVFEHGERGRSGRGTGGMNDQPVSWQSFVRHGSLVTMCGRFERLAMTDYVMCALSFKQHATYIRFFTFLYEIGINNKGRWIKHACAYLLRFLL